MELRGTGQYDSDNDWGPCPGDALAKRRAKAEVTPGEAHVKQLRKRTHEIAEAKDKEHAERARELGKLQQRLADAAKWANESLRAFKHERGEMAEEPIKGMFATPYPWWNHASEHNRMAVLGLLEQLDRTKQQLPEEMRHCTVVFEECTRGHGHLRGTNWTRNPCAVCERNEAREQLAAAQAERDALLEQLNQAHEQLGKAWAEQRNASAPNVARAPSGPKRPEYTPRTQLQCLGYLTEECGEVLAAAGKSIRRGLDSTNPELPPEQRETNAAWLLREMDDLEAAIAIMRAALTGESEVG